MPEFGITGLPCCPRCGSPSPERHPAMQAEGGEVQPCPDPFHGEQHAGNQVASVTGAKGKQLDRIEAKARTALAKYDREG